MENKIKQNSTLFKVGDANHDIPKDIILVDHSILMYMNDLSESQIIPFLDYQFKNTPLPQVFISFFYNNITRINKLFNEKTGLVFDWIDQNSELTSRQRKKIDYFFGKPRSLFNDIKDEFNDYLEGLDINDVLAILNNSKERLEQEYEFHKIICLHPHSCTTNEEFEDSIEEIEKLIRLANQQIEKANPKTKETNPEFTTARQVLALYYLFTYLKLDFEFVNNTDLARFTRFLTGKEINGKIINTNIYKKWKKVLVKRDKEQVQDLEYIKQYFNKLGLSEVTKLIDNDIDSYKS